MNQIKNVTCLVGFSTAFFEKSLCDDVLQRKIVYLSKRNGVTCKAPYRFPV